MPGKVLALWLCGVLPGYVAVAVSGYYLLQDWASLNRSFARWEHLARTSHDMHALIIADTYQHAFRINCFADGVGVLLGALVAAIGVHGLCLLHRNP
ncbi:MAG: hypothetical protein JO316_26075 [Abitibacteriaceae bacterium]|nr:hypothetical protein [Abditibacteriaceae bacterium]